jgi:hypothetical protein
MRRGTHRLLGVLAAFPLIKAAAGIQSIGLWSAIYAFVTPYLLVAFAGAIIKAKLRKFIDALIHGVAIVGIFVLMRVSLVPTLMGPGWWNIPMSDATRAFGQSAEAISPMIAIILTAYYAERGGRFPDLDWTKEEDLRIKRNVVSRERMIHRVLLHNATCLFATTVALAIAIYGRIGDLSQILIAAWIVGYGTHLISDAITKRGCAITYPFSRTLYLRDVLSPASRRRLLETGGWREAVIDVLAFVMLIAIIINQPPIKSLLKQTWR